MFSQKLAFYCMEKTKIFREFTKKIIFTVEFAVDFEISGKLSQNHREPFINFATNIFSSFMAPYIVLKMTILVSVLFSISQLNL